MPDSSQATVLARAQSGHGTAVSPDVAQDEMSAAARITVSVRTTNPPDLVIAAVRPNYLINGSGSGYLPGAIRTRHPIFLILQPFLPSRGNHLDVNADSILHVAWSRVSFFSTWSDPNGVSTQAPHPRA